MKDLPSARPAARPAALPELRLTLRRLIAWGPFMPSDELYDVLEAAAAALNFRIRRPNLPVPDLPDPGPEALAAPSEALRAAAEAGDTTALVALALLPHLDEAGYLRTPDPELAAELRIPEEDVAAARRRLQAEFDLAWPSIADRWAALAEAAAWDVPPEWPRLIALLRAHEARGARDARAFLADAADVGIPPARARAVLAEAVRRFGLRPAAADARPADPRRYGASPDIIAVHAPTPDDPDRFEYTVPVPRVARPRRPDATTTVATIVLEGRTPIDVARTLRALPHLRRRRLGALFELAMRYNAPYFAGRRYYRRPVPTAELQTVCPTPPIRTTAFYTTVLIDNTPHPMWFVLGYSLHEGRIVHVPLESVREIAAAHPGVGVRRLCRILDDYGIPISSPQLYRILRTAS